MGDSEQRVGITPRSWTRELHHGVLHLGKRWYVVSAEIDEGGLAEGVRLDGPYSDREAAEARPIDANLTGMRIAAISDIHGNLPALEAVLAEAERERPDLLVFCGDVASGPMPAETIDRLLTFDGARFVRGNADRGLIDEFDRKPAREMPGPFGDWCSRQITKRQRDFLASFEDSVTVDDVDGLGSVLFCHASPRNDTDIFTVETPDDRVRLLLAGAKASVVVCGHTHMQFDRRVDRIRVVNAGSVGMPYGEPGAYWAMLGPDVDLRRTDYDREAAAQRIRAKDWDNAATFAAENVLSVPSVEQALDFMRKAEAKQTASAC